MSETRTLRLSPPPFPPVTIRESRKRVEFGFPLARELVCKESKLVAVEFDRTVTVAGDGREFGAVSGSFAIR